RTSRACWKASTGTRNRRRRCWKSAAARCTARSSSTAWRKPPCRPEIEQQGLKHSQNGTPFRLLIPRDLRTDRAPGVSKQHARRRTAGSRVFEGGPSETLNAKESVI